MTFTRLYPLFRKRARLFLDVNLHVLSKVGSSDIDGVNIIAFRQINQFDLSGNVQTSPEHLPTLSVDRPCIYFCGIRTLSQKIYNFSRLFVQVKLYRSDNLDNPINSASLGQSLFFHFPPLDRDGEVGAVIHAFSVNSSHLIIKRSFRLEIHLL